MLFHGAVGSMLGILLLILAAAFLLARALRSGPPAAGPLPSSAH